MDFKWNMTPLACGIPWDQLLGCSSSCFCFVAQNLPMERIHGCPGMAWECVAFFSRLSLSIPCGQLLHFWRDRILDFPWSSWMWCSASPGDHHCLEASVTTLSEHFLQEFGAHSISPNFDFPSGTRLGAGMCLQPNLFHPGSVLQFQMEAWHQPSNIQQHHHIPGGENSKMRLENIWGNKISGACWGRGSQFCESRLQP